MNNPLVSVIIPFYAQVDWLAEAVASVLQQTFTDYEIIVVNDGSREDDSRFLAEFGTRIRYIRKDNSGPGPTRNRGIGEARGKYLAFLDSDDLWMPEKLALQVEYLEKTGEIWCMSTYVKFGDGMDETLVDNTYFQKNLYPICFYHMHFATPSVIVRKDYLLERNLRFSESMRYGQDAFLWLNIILSGIHEIKVFSQPLIKVRMRGGNANRRAKCHLQGKAQLWDYLSKFRQTPECPEIPATAVFLYRWCQLGFNISEIQNRLLPGKRLEEYFARALYLMPFLLFKKALLDYRKNLQGN